MGQIVESLRRSRAARLLPPGRGASPAPEEARAFRVIAVTGDEGPLGHATVAANLALHARALRRDLPVLLLPLAEGPSLEPLFDLGDGAPRSLLGALREGSLAPALRLGRHGVHWTPSPSAAGALAELLAAPGALDAALRGSGFAGLVVVDVPDAPEPVARDALGACDLAVVVVKERASLPRAQRVLGWLRETGRERERVRLVLSLHDPVTAPPSAPDDLALLLGDLRRRRWRHVAALLSDRPGHASPTEAAPLLYGSAADRTGRQMRAVAEELLEALAELGEAPVTAETRPRDAAESSAWGGGSPRAFHRFLLRESTAPGGG